MTRVTLLTGGAGFVGSHIAEALLAAGRPVRILDWLHPAAHAADATVVVPDGAELIRGDVRDRATVEAALRGVDDVCHQAAMVGLGSDFADVADYVSHNDGGTAELLRALATRPGGFAGRLVLASSMVVYGEGAYACPADGPRRPPPRTEADLRAGTFEPRCPDCGGPLVARSIDEDAPTDPRNVYAATKLQQEQLAFAFARETGVPVAALRYHNVYGPRMPRDTPYAGVAAIFRSQLEAGGVPRVFEDGAQRRDFVHVRDVARANLLALEAAVPIDGPVNVCSGEPRSVGELASALALAADGPPPLVTGEYRLGDVRHVFASAARARRVLGFEAREPFEAGVAEFATAPLRAAAAAVG